MPGLSGEPTELGFIFNYFKCWAVVTPISFSLKKCVGLNPLFQDLSLLDIDCYRQSVFRHSDRLGLGVCLQLRSAEPESVLGPYTALEQTSTPGSRGRPVFSLLPHLQPREEARVLTPEGWQPQSVFKGPTSESPQPLLLEDVRAAPGAAKCCCGRRFGRSIKKGHVFCREE